MERTKSETIKSLFEVYFDGCYGIESQPNTSCTYTMGICKLDFNEEDNSLTVSLRRPGLLIGKAGITITALEKHLSYKILINEITKF